MLTVLDVKNGDNSKIVIFEAQNNSSLDCIQIDDETAANSGTGSYGTWLKDASTTYAEDCGYVLSLNDELLTQSISLYPNPVTNILTIDSEIPLVKVEIYSMLGKKIKEVKSNFKSISLENISKGIYLVNIHSKDGFIVKKVIKK